MIRRVLPLAQAEIMLPFEGEHYVVSLISMAAIPSKRLRRKAGSLAEHEETLQRALHLLFTGF